jgi:predicted xylan-binding protein with Ca-dependent carbohydrate-binding module
MSGSTSNFIGSGSDTITLKMSEDQALGVDAKFTVNVDGQQIGDVQTVAASHADGQDDTFNFQGNYGPGPHNVVVTFDNNFIYPGLSGDRNLFVDGVSYDGQTVSNSTTPIYETPFFPPNSTEGNVYGNAVFTVNDTTSIPNGAPSTQTTTPGPVSVGSGPDNLVLNMAEDAYLGDAQFTVSVDGKQIGGTQTTTALVDEGQQQEFDVHGDFGGGNHSVSVNFLNDQIGGFYPAGTPGVDGSQWAIDTTDRNLYVMGMSLNGGAPASGTPWELSSSGSFSWNVNSGSNASASDSISASGTSDTATITSGSLDASSNSAGSNTGMSFVASPDTSATTDTSGLTSSDLTGSGTSGTTTDTLASTATGGATPSTQDFSVPATTDVSGSNTTTTTTGGSSGNWWMGQHAAGVSGTAFHQNG